MLSWLLCTMDENDSLLVVTLMCAVCTRFEASICGLKNFYSSWISGFSNHRMSNVDHAKSDQHKASMMRLHADQAKTKQLSITSYSPIVRSLRMDESTERLCHDQENVAFRKYPALHELETCHGVDLGPAYKMKDSVKNFTHYIA